MGKAVTIKDVAARGGVSKTAVSYVLSGREAGVRISIETRQRVLAAAQDLGYHPNALARGLARHQTDTLALVMQFPSVFSGWSGFTNELMHGATDAATALGFDLMLHTKALDTAVQDAAALTDGRADGALLLRDRDDPLADIRLGHEDYAWITARLAGLARVHAGGRLVSTLEGGYDLAALAACASAHVSALME